VAKVTDEITILIVQGVFYMTQLNQMELQNLRHLIGSHDLSVKKLSDYASQCQDPQIKQVFQQSAQDAQNTKNQLMTFLG
jgi:hypothetical protein